VGYPEERNQEGGLKKVSSYGEVLAKRAARELMAGKTIQEVSPIFKSGFAGGFVPNFAELETKTKWALPTGITRRPFVGK